MRGHDEQTHHMFSYLSPEQRVPADHPLRAVRALTDHALKTMSRRFAGLYAKTGRPSIPPEQLLWALLLQVLYTIRSERLLMEEVNDNLLFRWFVGLNMDDPVWHPTTFTKNRDRLLAGDVAAAFFDAVQAHARAAGLLSDEHFTVDGTQLEAWASLKSFRCRDAAPSAPPDDPGNPTVDFHGERRRNDTHQSTTDPEAMLHRKGQGKEAKLAYLGHVLLDNRHGLVANVCATHATGTAEREAAALLLEASAPPGSTVGADKGYDVASFVADVRVRDVTPHVAQKVRWSAIDGRTTRHAGYHVSQRKRKLVEQVFGWMKTVGGLRKLRHRGVPLVDWQLTWLCCNFRAATSGWTTFGKHRTGSPIMPSDNPFKWRQFEPSLILQCVRWYLRYALSYRDLEDMMRERGLCVDHTTIYRWVQRYAPEIDKRCRPFLRRTNDSYRIDETYVRVAGAWTYLYRGVDSNGDTLDFLLRATRDRKAAIAFFRKTLGAAHTTPPRVVTVDKNPAYPVAFEAVRHEGLVRPRSNLRQCKYLNNILEQDHRFIKRRTRPMLGFKRFTTAWRTLRGIEIMHALRKGQARWMAKGDVVGQTQLIHKVFGLAA